MTATSKDRARWIEDGKKQKAEYLIIACDTFDFDNYPVYCSQANLEKEKRRISGSSMQKIDEVIEL